MFVFILAIGFYITPALVGGRDDQMITWYIAWYTSLTLNWGAAAALSAMLLLFTVILYALMDKGFGISRLRMQRE
jgi:putative spermidine/putrescine transport system permease protein